jgi:hypothetical protein
MRRNRGKGGSIYKGARIYIFLRMPVVMKKDAEKRCEKRCLARFAGYKGDICAEG